MSHISPSIDAFFSKTSRWKEEYNHLRSIILRLQLTEELKWGKPCYTLQGANVVLIHGFKEYCALLFHKGVMMNDPDGILVQQTENVQVPRQLRFTSLEQIREMEPSIMVYMQQAIEVEKSGKKVEMKETSDFPKPEEFLIALEENAAFKTAFEGLTSGRQRGYLLHFSQPKQSHTRLSRIEKHYQRILDGKGINDR